MEISTKDAIFYLRRLCDKINERGVDVVVDCCLMLEEVLENDVEKI